MSAILTVSLLGGLLSLEQRAKLEFMVSQPVCGGLLTGFALGDPAAGLFSGAMFQAMFLGFVAVRGKARLDMAVGGVTASACYVISVHRWGSGPAMGGIVLLCSLLFGIAASMLGYAVYRVWERRAWAFFEVAMASALAGQFRRANAIHLATVGFHFLYGFAVLLALVPAGTAVIGSVSRWIEGGAGGSINALQYIVPLIGVGSLSRLYFVRSKAFWFGAGFLVTYLFFIVRS